MRKNFSKHLVDYVAIMAFFVAVGFLIVLHVQRAISLRLLLMLVPLSSLGLLDFFIMKNPVRSLKSKLAIGGFSLAIALAFCVFYLKFATPASLEKFGPNDFGILLIEAEGQNGEHGALHQRLVECIRALQTDELAPFRQARCNMLTNDKPELAGAEPRAYAELMMRERNARLASFCRPCGSDSLCETIFVNQEVVKQGLPREKLELKFHRREYVQSMTDNIVALWQFMNGKRAFDASSAAQQPAVLTLLAAQRSFAEGKQLFEQLNALTGNSRELEEIVSQTETAMRRSLQHDSLNDDAYNILAHLKVRYQNDYEEASKLYEEAQTLKPGKYEYNWNLAQSYHEQGKKTEAVQVLQNYLDTYGERLTLLQYEAMSGLLVRYKR